VAIAEDLAVIHDPGAAKAFHVEQHGVDFIPPSERWATPRDVFGMWAGASIQVEYFIYGCILMTFGLTFVQVVIVIVLGNLSYLLLGLCSLQGPQSGTTVFAINRAAFGPNGGRPISFFNWITQIGFEVEGLILIVGAGLVLMIKAGFSPADPAKVILVIVAVLVQGIIPFFGYAAIVKTLRALVIPFIVLFAVMLGFALAHVNTHVVRHSGDWQGFLEALAFTIALSGLGWAECGNDYTRYCPADTSKKGIVGWVFLRWLPAFCPPERHSGLVRGGLPDLRHRPTLRHQQPGHVLVGRDLAGARPTGEALPGRAVRLCRRAGDHDVGHLQRILHRVPL
jgi:NCS1 family nucleobase:cation symporter-1